MSQVLAGLRQIYPPYLLAVALFPLLAGYFIDRGLVEARDVIIHLAWMPLFTIPVMIFKSKHLYRAWAILYFVVGFIELGHWILMKGPVTITSFLVMANTNLSEALEFADLKASLRVIWLLPYISIFIKALKPIRLVKRSKTMWATAIAVALFSLVFITENAANGRLVRKGSPQVIKVGVSFIQKINLYREALQDVTPKKVDATAGLGSDEQTFVLILGESASRRHMALYGYPRNTTPKFKARTDLIVYQDAISAYSYTLASVMALLSESNQEQEVEFMTGVDLIDIFHAAGFKTYWLSNQSPIGVWDNLVTVLANKSDKVHFVNTSSNSSFEATLARSYDDKLFAPFANVLKDEAAKKFIVLHLMGSHSAYSKRYPKRFDVFSADEPWRQTVAEYDNSMLYNDYVVDSLLNFLRANAARTGQPAAAIYLADHGENVYDENGEVGHTYTGKLPKANVEVPFFVWLSPEYSRLMPLRDSTIRQNVKLPFMTDDLFHCIMDLNAIESPHFIKEKSVFNHHFNFQRKRILEDGEDYDVK